MHQHTHDFAVAGAAGTGRHLDASAASTSPFFAPFGDVLRRAYPERRRPVLETFEPAQTRGVVSVSGADEPGSARLEVPVGPGAQTPDALSSYPGGPQWDWASGRNTWTDFDFAAATGAVTFRCFNRNDVAFHRATYTP